MAKVFDLVHKMSDGGSSHEESRIPFEDETTEKEKVTKPKRKIRVEIVFFYLLLFAVFFIMGAVFLAPNLFAGSVKRQPAATQKTSPSPGSSPNAGFAIEKQGQSTEDAAKALGANSTPSPRPTSSPTSSATTNTPSTSPTHTTTQSAGAQIQILNGTNTTGAAATLRSKLANRGIVVDSIGNFTRRNVQRTTVYFEPDYKKAAQDVLAVTGGIMIEEKSIDGGHDILVIIGYNN